MDREHAFDNSDVSDLCERGSISQDNTKKKWKESLGALGASSPSKHCDIYKKTSVSAVKKHSSQAQALKPGDIADEKYTGNYQNHLHKQQSRPQEICKSANDVISGKPPSSTQLANLNNAQKDRIYTENMVKNTTEDTDMLLSFP